MSASLRCFTGTNAATMSAAQTAVSLLSVDAATNDPGSHQVAPGGAIRAYSQRSLGWSATLSDGLRKFDSGAYR